MKTTTTKQSKATPKASGNLYRNLERVMKVVNQNEMGSFFNLHLDMLCIINMNTRLTRVSAAFCNILGYAEAELISRPFTEMVYEDDRAKTIVAYNNAKEGKCASTLEHRCVCKNGEIKWLKWDVMPVPTEGVIYAVARDITVTKNHELKIKRHTEELEEMIRQKEESLRYARHLQHAVNPDIDSLTQVFPESFIYFEPKDIVSGDFFWMETLDLLGRPAGKNGELVIMAAADCTGHGVPAAMLTLMCSNALSQAVKELGITKPGNILDRVCQLVTEKFAKSNMDIQDGMDISLCMLDKTTGMLFWSGANTPLYYVSDGILEEITATKQPIGGCQPGKPFITHSLQLEKGNMIYLFSDGYASQFGGAKGKKFMYSNFRQMLAAISGLNGIEQQDIIKATFENWKGQEEQVDDVTVIGIKI